MYVYDDFDQRIINERVAQFQNQMDRYLDGKIPEEEFLPLRLQNGIYIQRYAPMLRIAVPYGMLNSKQLRKLAEVARDYDRGYAHVPVKTSNSIGLSLKNAQRFWVSWRKFRCTRFRPVVTVFVILRPMNMPV